MNTKFPQEPKNETLKYIYQLLKNPIISISRNNDTDYNILFGPNGINISYNMLTGTTFSYGKSVILTEIVNYKYGNIIKTTQPNNSEPYDLFNFLGKIYLEFRVSKKSIEKDIFNIFKIIKNNNFSFEKINSSVILLNNNDIKISFVKNSDYSSIGLIERLEIKKLDKGNDEILLSTLNQEEINQIWYFLSLYESLKTNSQGLDILTDIIS